MVEELSDHELDIVFYDHLNRDSVPTEEMPHFRAICVERDQRASRRLEAIVQHAVQEATQEFDRKLEAAMKDLDTALEEINRKHEAALEEINRKYALEMEEAHEQIKAANQRADQAWYVFRLNRSCARDYQRLRPYYSM